MSKNNVNRILSLRLQRKKYPSEMVERYLTYRGNKIDLTDEMYDQLLSIIPDLWNTEKDRLVQFVWFEDRTFLCVRNKDVYNFSLKESEEKIYFFESVTVEQLDSFVKLLTEFFNKLNLEYVQNFYDNVYDKLSDLSFVKQKVLQMREVALSESDYMFNSDYEFEDIEEETKWKEYRKEWRDITQKDFWLNNDFMNLSLPVAPKPKKSFALLVDSLSSSLTSVEVTDNLMKELELDVEGYANLASNYGSIMFKLEILKTLSSLKLPIFLVGDSDSAMKSLNEMEQSIISTTFSPLDLYNRFNSVEDIESSSNITMKSLLDRQINDCDEKLKLINERLQEYNIDFSMGDIIEKYLEDMKRRNIQIEKEIEAQELLNEISMGETL